MENLKVFFELPQHIRDGLIAGTYERIGGVIRKARGTEGGGQIVAWLREATPNNYNLAPSGISPLPLITAGASILSVGLTVLYGSKILRELKVVQKKLDIIDQKQNYLIALGHEILRELENIKKLIKREKLDEIMAKIESSYQQLMQYEDSKTNKNDFLIHANNDIINANTLLKHFLNRTYEEATQKMDKYNGKLFGEHISGFLELLDQFEVYIASTTLQLKIGIELGTLDASLNAFENAIHFSESLIKQMVTYLCQKHGHASRVKAVLIDGYWNEHQITPEYFILLCRILKPHFNKDDYYKDLMDSISRYTDEGLEWLGLRNGKGWVFIQTNDNGKSIQSTYADITTKHVPLFYKKFTNVIALLEKQEGYLEEYKFLKTQNLDPHTFNDELAQLFLNNGKISIENTLQKAEPHLVYFAK